MEHRDGCQGPVAGTGAGSKRDTGLGIKGRHRILVVLEPLSIVTVVRCTPFPGDRTVHTHTHARSRKLELGNLHRWVGCPSVTILVVVLTSDVPMGEPVLGSVSFLTTAGESITISTTISI